MEQLSTLELHRVVKELQICLGGKINQIYVDREKKEMLFEIFVSNQGRKLLRIIFPSLMFLASVKPEMPQKPDGYCAYLRKYLRNARVKAIEQVDAERIVCITLEARDLTKKEYNPVFYKMYIELFSKGNFILANDHNLILSPFEIQEWAGRSIKAREQYKYPKQEYNLFTLSEEEYAHAMRKSSKDSVVTVLALEFGLGGRYAEEICLRAEIAKETKPVDAGTNALFSAFQSLLHDVETGRAVIVNNHVFPCSLKQFDSAEKFDSYMEALDAFLSPKIMKKEEKEQVSKNEKAKTKVQVMIDSQEKQIQVYEEEHQQNQLIGEAIYQNYQILDEISKELKECKSVQDFKKVQQTYPQIKKIHLKEAVIEI
jgi:predicted ribosome quality control (RQC) complex YloA/Tae2 family protein